MEKKEEYSFLKALGIIASVTAITLSSVAFAVALNKKAQRQLLTEEQAYLLIKQFQQLNI